MPSGFRHTETAGFTGLKPPVSDMAETAGFSLKPPVSGSLMVSRQSAGHQWQSLNLARRWRFVGVGGPRRLSKSVDRPGGDLGLRGSNPQIHTACRGIVEVRPRSAMTWPRLAVGELDSGRRFGADAMRRRWRASLPGFAHHARSGPNELVTQHRALRPLSEGSRMKSGKKVLENS